MSKSQQSLINAVPVVAVNVSEAINQVPVSHKSFKCVVCRQHFSKSDLESHFPYQLVGKLISIVGSEDINVSLCINCACTIAQWEVC